VASLSWGSGPWSGAPKSPPIASLGQVIGRKIPWSQKPFSLLTSNEAGKFAAFFVFYKLGKSQLKTIKGDLCMCTTQDMKLHWMLTQHWQCQPTDCKWIRKWYDAPEAANLCGHWTELRHCVDRLHI